VRAADRLGRPGSGGQRTASGPGPASDRGRAKAKAEGTIPDYELVRLALDEVSPTPLNPRKPLTEQAKSELGESLSQQQITACVAVSRDVYLKLWPEHVDHIAPEALHVLCNGERRMVSALHVGLERLDFVVRDDLATTRESFIANLLRENLEREDFDLIERAIGVRQMVEACGDNVSAARFFKKDKSWVTNQLALLTLPEEIQVLLSEGEMPERFGRQLARRYKENRALTPADLLVVWEELKAAESAAKEERKGARKQKNPRAALDTGQESGSDGEGARLSMDNRSTSTPLAKTGLSMDNPGPHASPAKSRLSMDNRETEALDPRLPSARSSASSHDLRTTVSPQEAVSLLGETTEERARTLREGLSEQEFEALVGLLVAQV